MYKPKKWPQMHELLAILLSGLQTYYSHLVSVRFEGSMYRG